MCDKQKIVKKNKKCCQEGCNKQPSFNFEGEKEGLFCKKLIYIN